MKKLFSILLTLAMLLNVGIVVMADEIGVNLFADWGGFENNPTITLKTGTEYATKVGDNITVKSSYVGDKVNIFGLTDEAKKNGTYSLKIQLTAQYSPKITATVDTGAFYKLSADFMMAGSNSRTIGFNTYNNQATASTGVYAVKFDDEGKVSSFKDSYQKYPTKGIWGSETVQPQYWNNIEEYFYIPASSSATKSVPFGMGIASKDTFYVDNICLEKIGTGGSINGANTITKSASDSVTYQYTVSDDSVYDISDVALVGDYGDAVRFDNTTGELTVTPEAPVGTIQLAITKTVVSTETVFASKDIVIEENLAESPNNLIAGGTFEDDSYKTAMAEQAWTHASFDESPTTEAKHNGQYSLKIYQPTSYYPATFKAPLERGGIYKFTAYVKALEGNDINKANLVVRSGEFSNRQDKYRVYELQDGTLDGTLNNAGDLYGTKNKATFNTSDFVKFERYFYVTDSINVDTFTGYIGIRHNGSGNAADFNYYVDDVSLIKVGEAKLSVDAKYVDGAGTVNYSFTSDVAADNAVVALKEEKAGVTYADGTITIAADTEPGVITLQVKEDSTVIAKKDIVLFDEAGEVYIKTADSATGAVKYNAYVKESVHASGTLLNAKYGTAFESVASYNSVDMGDFWKIEQSFTLGDGTYKFMLWDGIGTMIPIAEAYEVEVAISEE